MIGELEKLEDLGAEMCRRARSAGMLLIWRVQARSVARTVVRQGKTEGVSVSSSSGHGAQVVTPEGRTALASRDDLRPEPALLLLQRVMDAATVATDLDLAPAALAELRVVRARRLPPDPDAFERVQPAAVISRLAELESEILGRVPGTLLEMSFRAELDAWRIFRSDGSDVLFAMPRCTVGLRATSGGGATRHGVSALVFGTRPDLPWDEAAMRLFLKRGEAAARLARELPLASVHPAGSFPLVIDYGLAKGLAHEAFGHAAEADGYRSSVLAQDGKYRSGERVGADHVSIVDEPIEGDHAWQPFSANGLVRERATLVDHGRLADGLADLGSAEAGGVRLTGAARAESFNQAPLPRMSNIRIEVDRPLPAPGEFEDYGPQEVRDLLAAAGVLSRHPRIVYLSGYSGGQVNTATGDFVFNCRAIYVLGRDGISFHKPAILSGSMFGALKAVREAFGPLMLDAVGYCGKWGQSVPSSGGSHYFLVLEADPSVRLGGA